MFLLETVCTCEAVCTGSLYSVLSVLLGSKKCRGFLIYLLSEVADRQCSIKHFFLRKEQAIQTKALGLTV